MLSDTPSLFIITYILTPERTILPLKSLKRYHEGVKYFSFKLLEKADTFTNNVDLTIELWFHNDDLTLVKSAESILTTFCYSRLLIDVEVEIKNCSLRSKKEINGQPASLINFKSSYLRGESIYLNASLC
jgi:hypothetical protein